MLLPRSGALGLVVFEVGERLDHEARARAGEVVVSACRNEPNERMERWMADVRMGVWRIWGGWVYAPKSVVLPRELSLHDPNDIFQR